MEWIDAVKLFGPFGLLVGALYMLGRDWMQRHERIEMRKLTVEEKRVDTILVLGTKIDAHASADIQSHQDMAEGIASLHGKLEGVLGERDRTPVDGMRRVTPPQGVPAGYYGPRRPGTKGDR